jgi:hypothetical protein
MKFSGGHACAIAALDKRQQMSKNSVRSNNENNHYSTCHRVSEGFITGLVDICLVIHPQKT